MQLQLLPHSTSRCCVTSSALFRQCVGVVTKMRCVCSVTRHLNRLHLSVRHAGALSSLLGVNKTPGHKFIHAGTEMHSQAPTQVRKEDHADSVLPSSSSSSSSSPPPQRHRQSRYYYVHWEFEQYARLQDISGAMEYLQRQGQETYQQQQQHLAEQQRVALIEIEKKELTLIERGQKPPPRPKQWMTTATATTTRAVNYLHYVPYETYMSLMRTFASYGQVDSCYTLLARLYQLAQTDPQPHTTLLPWDDPQQDRRFLSPRQRKKLQYEQRQRKHTHRYNSNKKRSRLSATHHLTKTNEQKQQGPQQHRSVYTPTADLLAAIMSAYTYYIPHPPNTHPYELTHHHTLFQHHRTLNLPPTKEFYYSLLQYHISSSTVTNYLADMSLLSRSRYPPTVDDYIPAIQHYGLRHKNTNAALQIFLALNDAFLPNSNAYNTLIEMFAQSGEYTICYRLLNDMEIMETEKNKSIN